MDPKAKSALDKALQEKVRGNHDKALKKLQETIRQFPSEPELYIEAAEVCFEGGESLGATQFLKKAYTRFADERDRIVGFARERAGASNDPVVGKFLLEQLVKRRELTAALECLNDLQDRAIRDLLQRSRTKRQSLTSATAGGYTLKGEMITNSLSEGLLCFRLGRFKEAVRTLLHLIEEKPVENEVLEPFFARLEKAHPKSGRIRVGYAVSLLAANNPEAAMTRFVQAAQIERPLADECLERIRNYCKGLEHPPAAVDLATVEILLIKGDHDRAADVLSRQLESSSTAAAEIMEMVRPHLEQAETLSLHYVFMNAALAAEQTVSVLETLRRVRQEEAHRPDLIAWLDQRGGESFLPPDVMIFHGELAIDTGNYDRAHEILSAVCTASPGDVGAVSRLLERSRGKDASLDALLEKHAQPDPLMGGSGGRVDFEHFENSEFKFNSTRSEPVEIEPEPEPEPAPEPEPEPAREAGMSVDSPLSLGGDDDEDDYDPEFDNFSGRSVFARTQPEQADEVVWEEEDESGQVEPVAETEVALDVEPVTGTEVALDDPVAETEVALDEEPVAGTEVALDEEPADEAEETLDEDPVTETEETIDEEPVAGTEVALDEEPADEAQAPPPPEPAITGAHVDNLARALRASGAATFFHVDAGEDESPVAAPAPATEDIEEETAKEIEASESSEKREEHAAEAAGTEEEKPDPIDADLDVAVPELIDTSEEPLEEAAVLEKETSLVTDL